MLRIVETYKSFLVAGFLFLYLTAIFQDPVLESLHYLSHLVKKEQKHHYHTHTDATHSHHHGIIELISGLLAPFSDGPAPATDKAEALKKQFAECPHVSFQLAKDLDAGLPERTHRFFIPFFVYLSVPTPPPRLV